MTEFTTLVVYLDYFRFCQVQLTVGKLPGYYTAVRTFLVTIEGSLDGS